MTKEMSFNELTNNDLSEKQNRLIQAAKQATENAYAPYSNFRVGAAVYLDNDTIVTGSNQENAAYPSGLCAERVALNSAHHQYPGAKVKALAVAAVDNGEVLSSPIMPCGACAQVISESVNRSGAPFEVLLVGKQHVLHIPNALYLMPFRFEM